MNVGILLVTHPGIGPALVSVVTSVLGGLPLKAEAFEVPLDGDLNILIPQARVALHRVDSGAGVLLLTDVYGATPSNLAAHLVHLGIPVRQIAGVNLPMLLRIMNYCECSLDDLRTIAAAGARNGVVDA